MAAAARATSTRLINTSRGGPALGCFLCVLSVRQLCFSGRRKRLRENSSGSCSLDVGPHTECGAWGLEHRGKEHVPGDLSQQSL